jgi:hypothetical protein
MRKEHTIAATNAIWADGGGASVENCGNTHNEYKVCVTINIDMRGTSRERFTERLDQVRELAESIGFNFPGRSIQWDTNERTVKLSAESIESIPPATN